MSFLKRTSSVIVRGWNTTQNWITRTWRQFRLILMRPGHHRRTKRSAPPYERCYNCGQELHGTYCHNCGQYARDITPSVGSFIWQYFENSFQWDGKFVRTVRIMFARPGCLAVAFAKGYVSRYVFPLKLYMLIMVLFSFVTIFATNSVVSQYEDDNAATYAVDSLAIAQLQTQGLLDSAIAERVKLKITDTKTAPPKERTVLTSVDNYKGRLPFIIMFAMPFFAVLTRGFYRRRYPTYIPHLVNAIHIHTAFFIMLILQLFFIKLYPNLIPQSILVLILWFVWYCIVDSIRFYRSAWWAATLKTIAIIILYVIFCFIILLIGFLINLWYDSTISGTDIFTS